jgi:hypothetical protein
VCDDVKVLKVRNWNELVTDRKVGVTFLGKPKSTKGCNANRKIIGMLKLG